MDDLSTLLDSYAAALSYALNKCPELNTPAILQHQQAVSPSVPRLARTT